MKIIKNIFSQLHTFVLWLLISVLLWGWIFSFLTDTSREKKIMIFVNAGELRDRELALRLEEQKPDGIKMIKVHDFEYQMIGTTKVYGDLYIVPESDLERMLEKDPGAVLPIRDPGGHPVYEYGGQPVAFLAYDAGTNSGIGASRYIFYPRPELDGQNFYLCISSDTRHYEGAEGAVDDAAWTVAMDLLTLWEQGTEIPASPWTSKTEAPKP